MLRNPKGFTVIEIIVVLVILGVLAVIAIPKYMDLQNVAKFKAIDGALSAGGSNIYMMYSSSILAGNPAPTMSSLAASLEVDSYKRVGDFTVSYSVVAPTSPCTGSIMVTYALGPPDGANASYYTDTAPSKAFCIY